MSFIPSHILLLLAFALSSCGNQLLVNPMVKGTSNQTIEKVVPYKVSAGTVVTVYGHGFKKSTTASIGGFDIPLSMLDSNKSRIIIPSGLADGLIKIDFKLSDSVTESVNVIQSADTQEVALTSSELPVESVCKGTVFKDKKGMIQVGSRDCRAIPQIEADQTCTADIVTSCVATANFPAVDKKQDIQNHAGLFLNSVSIAGVSGTMKECANGDSECYLGPYSLATHPLKAVDLTPVVPEVIKTGTILAGVTGNLLPRPADCAADGATGCVAVTNFPAGNQSAVNAARMRDSLTLGGVQGTLVNCAANADNCYVPPYVASSQTLKAIDTTSLTADVINLGSVVGGVTGTLSVTPPDCSADGAAACVTIAAFPSAKKSLLTAAKIHTSVTLAGVTGTQPDCSADGAIGCFTGATFPAAQKSSITAGLIRSGLTVAGVAGTLANCSANGSGCFIPSYLTSTQPLKAIDFESFGASDIKTGASIAGIAGTMTPRPTDCTVESATNCVATTTFSAVNLAGLNAGKAGIHSTLTIAGVAGTLGNCAANGSTSCYTVSSYPAVDKLALDATKIHLGLNLAGIAGSLADCSADGSTGCETVSSYPAIDQSNLNSNKAKIQSSLTIASVVGTLGNCAGNGSDCYLGPYAATSQPLKAINYDTISASHIKTGSAVAGISGTMIPKPVDCNADAQTSCVTVTDYPAVDKSNLSTNQAKLHSTLTAGGVVGTLTDCGTDGQTSCYAVANFPAALKSSLTANQAKFSSSLTIAGVTGTLADCGANDSNCYVRAYTGAGQPLKAINYDNIVPGILRSGVSVAAITGNVTEAPADCSADAQTNCVTVPGFPAVNLATMNANKTKVTSDVTIGGVAGTMPDCSTDGHTGCYTSTNYPAVDASNLTTNQAKISTTLTLGGVTGTMATCSGLGSNCMLPSYAAVSQPLKAINFDGITAAIIKTGTTIAGVAGSVAQAPANCSSDAQTACVAVASYPAMDYATVNAAKVRIQATVTAGGVTGTMANCSTDGETDCFAYVNAPSCDKVNLDAHRGLIRSSLTICGAAGSLADCSANSSACYLPAYVTTTQPLKAISYDSITADVIKNGTTVAGVAGQYPSATYPLSTGDAYTDLDSTTFNSQVTGSATFGWFDRNGTRQTKAGDTNIVATNIVSGVDIFGVTGNLTAALDPWDVRYGVNYGVNGGSTGKLKTSCRNLSSLANWDYGYPKKGTMTNSSDRVNITAHGFSNGDRIHISSTTGNNWDQNTIYYVINAATNYFQISTSSGGSAVNINGNNSSVTVAKIDGVANYWDTVDNYNYNTGVPTTNPWSAEYSCGGVEATAGDANVWKDVTTGGCAAGKDCRYMDKITKLQWSKRIGTGTHNFGNRVATCNDLTYDGYSDWRTPSQMEIQAAATHGFATAANANWVTNADLHLHYGTSTHKSDDDWRYWHASVETGLTWDDYVSWDGSAAICVRND